MMFSECMKNFTVLKYFALLSALSLLLFFSFSCKNEKTTPFISKQVNNFLAQATGFQHKNPDSVLKYAGLAFDLIKNINIQDSITTVYLQLKADALVDLGLVDSANNIVLSFRDEAMISGNKILQAYADLWLGQQFTDNGKYLLAVKYLNEGLLLFEKSGDEYQTARAHNLLGSVLGYSGDFQEAQVQLIKASELFDKLGKTEAMAAVFNNIALNYEATNDNGKALFYFNKSLHLSIQKHDTVNIISTLNNLGILYRTINPDSAGYFFEEALKMKNSHLAEFEIISVKFNLANLYFDRKEYKQAMEMYQQARNICISKKIYGGLARSFNGIANIYEAQNDDNIAMNYYLKAYQLADSIGETPIAMVFLGNIQYMHEKSGNYDKALELLKRIKATNDSLLSLDKQIALHDLEMLYNKEKTERQNDELNSRILIQKNSLRTNNIILFIVLISLVGLVILLWNIYRLYKQRDEAYKTLIIKYKEDFENLTEGKIPVEAVLIEKPDEPESRDIDFEKIIKYFENEKPYLNSKLKIEDVARAISMPPKIIIALVQKNRSTHFKSFVNSYRVNEALKMLADTKLRNLKIETIARESGFGSKVNFYSAFSQFTGSKPAIVREKGF